MGGRRDSGVAGHRCCGNLFYRGVVRGSRFKGMQPTSAGTGDTRDDPAYALPERLLHLVGVWNGVNRDHRLGHGHLLDLSIVIAHTGEDGR